MTPKHDFEHDVELNVEARVRQGVKAVLEEVLEEEMTQHLQAGYRELTPTRRGERNGYYQRNLMTPAGKIERLEVPRDREGEFVTEVFERYKRMTGDVEEAVLEMYLSGISVRKIAGVTDALSKVRVGKDAVSRIASRLEEEQKEWRERSLGEKAYPYLYLDATYLKVRWGARVSSMALLACVGVDEEGFREVLAEEFSELYGKRFPKAVSVFEAGIGEALTYLSFPGSHHAKLRTTNVLERLFKEIKRRTRVVGVFPNETSASTLATEIALRSSEEWALRRYLAMDALETVEKPNPQNSRH